ncbi:MAG TPA: hypothetical protein VJ302_20400 [Blastocatellia bacterium]|nr:hypothetical protein [Blastocatellia bacterium]
MKQIIQDIQHHLKKFIDDPRDRLLIISCAPENSALLLKSLDAIEEDPAVPDLFLTFGHPFADTESYVAQVLASVRQQADQVNGELVKRGDPPLALLSEEPAVGPQTPEARLSSHMQALRDLVPRERPMVWLLYPMEIGEPAQYLRLIDSISEHAASRRGVKLIVRDHAEQILWRHLQQSPGVRSYQPRLEPDYLMKELARQANDPRTPPEEQAQIHMMLAGQDVAERRFDRALARNQELLGYFRHTGQQHHQSVVLNNIGDLHYLQDRLDQAREAYEQAIMIAVRERSQPLVIYQSLNLGHVLQRQRRFDQALIYYRSAEQLAGASSALAYQLQALEQIGAVNRQTGQLDAAAGAWEQATELSRRYHFEYSLRDNLQRLLGLYQEMGDAERLERCRKTYLEVTGQEHERRER